MINNLTRSFLLLFIVSMSHAGIAASSAVFKDFSGQPNKIEHFAGKGKWLVVMIWAENCHVCNEEVSEYIAFHNRHENIDASVLGISIDGEESQAAAKAFLARHKPSFPNLISEPEDFMAYYAEIGGGPFKGTPTILLYTPEGTLSAAQAGAVPIRIIENYIASRAAAKSSVE